MTQEQPTVGRIIVGNGYTQTEVLTYAATVERKLTHPIAKAILTEAERLGLPLIEIEESQYQIGYGVLANIENQQVHVGSVRFIEQEGILIPETLKQQMEASYLLGHSLVMVAVRQTHKNNDPNSRYSRGIGTIRTNHFSKPGFRSNRFGSDAMAFFVNLTPLS